jgi:hypothetical protein
MADVRYWHKSDIRSVAINIRSGGKTLRAIASVRRSTVALRDFHAQIWQMNIRAIALDQTLLSTARPHFSHDSRTIEAGYSRSCSDPPAMS